MPESPPGGTMTPERWRAVLAVVEPALELPPAARADFVRGACGADHALRAEVESLLAADADAADFLEAPAPLPGRPERPDVLAARVQAALGDAYRVERELGGGGMSRVFVAEETRLGRHVAVKVLPRELGAALGAERFHREARLVATLRHPHIVPLLAAGEGADGLLYYTMPYVEGESLERRLQRDGPLPLGEVASLVRDVADALAHAHERGVVHRDVKPANVLMDGAHALVADFGIAKAAFLPDGGGGAPGPARPSGATLTTAGLVLGTPAYMSPEQASGGAVDARSDVYSLGCLAFELLTGRRPFADAAAATLARRLADPPPAATAHRPELPAAADRVLARAFAPLPDARYPGARELADALSALPGAGPATVPAPDVRAPAWWAPRRGKAAALASLAALVAVLVIVAAGARALARRAPVGDPPARRTLAVLPFVNVGRAGDAYFADGVADELASRLTNLPELRVILPSVAREYRATAKPAGQIGRELGADYLLQGRVRWERPAGEGGVGRVRLTAELVSARDGAAVWADRYEGPADDVVALEGEIGERVAAALELALGDRARATLGSRPTADFEAYSHFLRGEALRTAPSGAGGAWQAAAAEYERAVARDPRFALAYARLSEVHSRLYHANVDRSEARLARARTAGETAARLAPALAEARLALALYFYYGRRDYARASDELARALRAQPGRGELLQARGYVLRRQGHFAEAAASLERAVELDPRSALVAWDLAETYAIMRAYPQAMRYYDRALALDSGWAPAYAERARRLVAWRGDTLTARRIVREGLARADAGRLLTRLNSHATLLVGDGPVERAAVRGLTVATFGHDTSEYFLWRADWARLHDAPALGRAYADSARRRLARQVAANPAERGPRLALARAYAELGRRAEALEDARRAAALVPAASDAIDDANFLHDLAYVETIAGAHDAAVGRLDSLLRIPSDYTPLLLRADRRWAPLRDDARFRRLVGAAR